MAYPVYANRYTCSVSASRTAAGFAVPENSELKSLCGNELQAWYSSYPQQKILLTPKSIPGENFYVSQCAEAPNQKRFLVFDQSGNRTSMVYSPVGGYPFQYQFSSNLKPSDGNVSNVELPINKDTRIPDSVKKASWYGLDEKHETDVSGSEMHEDTEELDALLCSDDDEEASTGHSPSEMTGYEKHEVNDSAEVASSVTPTKRRRLEGEHDPSLIDTASYGKEWDYEDGTQSSCIKGGTPGGGSSASKRTRRKRIRETVGILRSIIPGGKGKDAVVVLDEAIRYLKTMRLKAKPLGAATMMQQQQQQ